MVLMLSRDWSLVGYLTIVPPKLKIYFGDNIAKAILELFLMQSTPFFWWKFTLAHSEFNYQALTSSSQV